MVTKKYVVPRKPKVPALSYGFEDDLDMIVPPTETNTSNENADTKTDKATVPPTDNADTTTEAATAAFFESTKTTTDAPAVEGIEKIPLVVGTETLIETPIEPSAADTETC
jgi:hypothetical protein